MILFTLTSLIKNPIYIGHNIKNSNKYIYKKYNNKYLINIYLILKYLSQAYLYFYKLSKYNSNILFLNFSIKNFFLVKSIASITNNFYINFTSKIDFIFNWFMFKNKLILLNWLEKVYTFYLKYLFIYLPFNLIIKLYNIYTNLLNKFRGIRYMKKLPENLFIINSNFNFLSKILKLKNLIIISIVDTNNNLHNIPVKILGNDENYLVIKFIFNILLTALLHGTLFI